MQSLFARKKQDNDFGSRHEHLQDSLFAFDCLLRFAASALGLPSLVTLAPVDDAAALGAVESSLQSND